LFYSTGEVRIYLCEPRATGWFIIHLGLRKKHAWSIGEIRIDRENMKHSTEEPMLVTLAPTGAVPGLNPDLRGEKPANKNGSVVAFITKGMKTNQIEHIK
jgi:hypothetical protein